MIRAASKNDFESIWPIFNAIVSTGLTYTWSANTSIEQARTLWIESAHKTFVYEDSEKVMGSYYIKANFGGAASHICNCGYMVSAEARGKGVATAMCQHSQQIALDLGYKAMQFNCVTTSNESAIRLWHKLGFETIGQIPKGFNHPELGYIDMLIMYKWLAPCADV